MKHLRDCGKWRSTCPASCPWTSWRNTCPVHHHWIFLKAFFNNPHISSLGVSFGLSVTHALLNTTDCGRYGLLSLLAWASLLQEKCRVPVLSQLTSCFLFFSWATSDMPFSTCLAWSSWAESFRLRSRILRARGSLGPLPAWGKGAQLSLLGLPPWASSPSRD